MRTKLITATILLVVGCGGYDTPTAVRPRLVEKSVESLHCTDEGPTDPGCPVLFLAGEYQDEMASAIGTADGLEPLWSGEPSSSVPGPYSCPQLVSFARNIVYIPQYGEDAVFLVDNLNKISDDGYSSLGEPMATYAVGPRTFNSVSPWQKYTMRGGTMRARCQVKTVRTGIGYRVILGRSFGTTTPERSTLPATMGPSVARVADGAIAITA